VFHAPEKAVRCEVAVEVAAHLRGITAKPGEEIELFL
jgi:hypothetical protein